MRQPAAPVLACLLFAGCPSAVAPDAGNPDAATADGGALLDASTPDAPSASMPGEPCTTDADCVAGTCLTQDLTGVEGGGCRLPCSATSECPASYVCASGSCRQPCAASSECRNGFLCYDLGDGQRTCVSGGTGTEPTGSACATQTECAGAELGRCLRFADSGQGMCTDGCTTDADCVGGGHCSLLESVQFCFADCTTDADCADSFVCDLIAGGDTVPECIPRFNPSGAAPGQPCAVPGDCAGRGTAACITEPSTTFGVCTVPCGPSRVCDAGTHCATLYGLDGTVMQQGCLPACTSDTDCAAGFGCIDSDDDGTRECYFSGVGAGALGSSCANVSECAGGERAICAHRTSGAGYCALDCLTTPCDAGSECLSTAGGRMCFPSCTAPADCPAGLTCRASAGGMACQI